MKQKMQTILASLVAVAFLFFQSVAFVQAEEDEFVPAYQNEGNYELPDSDKYFAYQQGRKYYTSGKENGFRVNENNEESTDETVGIVTFLLAPATLVYMNLVGWWD